ncbi:MAG TPA: protein kinase [Thermoanaerobaculaceae bacterium]|nr:protein kinase [Thermoanaerobaculaceae bacterium]HRS15251.1 protein kinase [Thermoanaerobaculaceae bacterium]
MARPDIPSLTAAMREAVEARAWDRGLALAEELCEVAPEDPRGWVGQALCLARAGRVAEARPVARRAVLLAPGDPEVRRLAADLARLPAAPAGPASPVPATLFEAETPAPPDAAAGPPPQHWPVGTVLEGRWEVRGAARGGMGEVVFVHDRAIGRMEAVKTPLPEQLASEEGRARFVREAEAWIGLGLHPNVCSAYFVHPIDGVPRLFIEYVDGGNLDEWLRSHGDAPLAERLDLAIQLAAGMQHAHTFAWEDEAGVEHRGIVHRDLKPANVLVTRDGQVRITDFGLVGRPGLSTLTIPPRPALPPGLPPATVSGSWSTLTMGDVVMGTPPYMPPEQWDGAHLVGPPGDVYAFGCILYELVAGRRPFQLEGGAEMLDPEVRLAAWERLHRTASPPDLAALVPGLAPELAELARQCLEKDAARRPASFAEIRERLTRVYTSVAGRPYERGEPEATTLLADTLNNQGVSWVTLGQPRRAEAAWRRALAVHPQHIEASYNLALHRWREGATDAETLAVLAEVKRAHTATWRDDHFLGRLALLLGEFDAALANLRVAADTAPDWEPSRDAALAAAAVAWRDSRGELWREALGRLDAHVERVASDPTGASLRIVALSRLGELAAARRAWESAAAAGLQLDASPAEAALATIPGACLGRRVAAVPGRATGAAVTPDGRMAVVVAEDGRVCILDPASGEVTRTLRPPGGRPRCVAMSPDGQAVLLAGGTERVGVWSLARAVGDRQLALQPGILAALAVSRDGQSVLGLGSEGSLTVWELASGARIASWRAHGAHGTCLAVAAIDRVVSAGADGTVKVHELPSGRTLAALELGPGQVVTALAASVDLSRVLLATEDRSVRVWDARTGRVERRFGGHADRIPFLALHPTEPVMLSASLDGTLRFWDLERGEPLAAVRVGAPVAAGAAGETLAQVLLAHGGGASLLDGHRAPAFRPGWALARPLTTDLTRERLTTFRFSLAEAEVRLGAEDWRGALERVRAARAVDGFARAPEALAVLSRLQERLPHHTLRDAWEEKCIAAHADRVTALALSPDGRLAFSAGADGQLAMWRLADGEAVWRASAGGGFETAAAFTPDGSRLVTGGLSHAVRVRDAAGGRPFAAWTGHSGEITEVVPAAGGEVVVTASVDHTVHVWELGTGTCRLVGSHHRAPVLAAALDPGERFVLSADDTGTVLLWGLERGNLLGRLPGHTAAVTTVAVSPDGTAAITGDRDGRLRFFDLATGRIARVLETPQDPITCLAFTPDGRFVASGGRSGSVRVWDPRARECLQTLGGHTAAVTGLAFGPGARFLLSASADGTLRSWFCEWEPEDRPATEWDERALPFLELFLHRHGPGPWREDALRELAAELGRRGFGWIRAEAVRRRLAELAPAWPGLLEPLARAGRTAATSRLAAPVATARGAPRWLVGLGLGLAGLLVVAAAAVWQTHALPRFDAEALERVRAGVQVALLSRHDAVRGECDRAALDGYVRTFAHPYEADAATAALAAACLERLADPRSVEPLLVLARRSEDPGEPPWEALRSYRGERVAATLARMSEPVVGEVAHALDDPDPAVRGTAARALAWGGSEPALAALESSVYDPEEGPRQAVASVLPAMFASPHMTAEKALALVERLAGDASPVTRRLAAEALAVLDGAGARRLARRLAADPDPEVRAAARGRR